MTTVVANPSGRKSAKDKKANSNKTASPPTVTPNNVPEPINQNSEEFRKGDKFQPTAEQMRIASLMSDKKDENDLKPKIEQIVELTGASKEDAAVALFDCDNDMTKAIEMILDGDSLDSEWHSTGRKKKTKPQIVGQPEQLTNGTKKTEKPLRTNLKTNNAIGSATAPQPNATKGQRGGFNAANKIVRKKEGRPDSKPENVEESDIFAKASTDTNAPADLARRGGRRGGGRGMRGVPRGGGKGPGAGRGSRTFMNRGLQSDGFPNSIETWTNSTAEQVKPDNDLNTMTVGNWSDIAANEDWSEEDWTSAPLETKVFTPSSKTIPEKDEIAEQNSPINNATSQNNAQLPFISPNKNEESAQPTMSAIISGSIKRQNMATPGQALLQQIQQSSASQNSNLNQYNLSQYSKQATESIKSLVGLSSNNIISNDLISSNEHSLENNLAQVTKQPTQVQNQQNRLKVQNQKTSKIPETAVEMPSNDPISNLSVRFGTLEFGANNSFGLGGEPNLFEAVSQNNVKTDKNLPLLSSTDNTSNANFRSPNSNANQPNKAMLQNSVMPPTLNDSLLNSDHRADKTLNANNYAANKQPIDRKNEYMNMSYKPSYVNNDNAYSSAYQASIPSSNVGYYSNANQVTPFGNSGPVNQSLMASSIYNTTYNNNVSPNVTNNAQNVTKMRDIDNSVPQQQVSASSVSNKPYETASNVGTSLSLMSNSTVTTNVLKNTLSATGKGVHNVPPGVQPTQVGQVLASPYIMSNAGMPIPAYPYPYDVQAFQTRDHGYPYAAADVKYNRGSESDMLPASSQAAGAVQTATQAHNQPYAMNTYPPGYGFYFTGVNFAAHQGLYNAAQHALYPVAQAQTTAGSAGSAFAKANTAANYGSHSYNSGYDSLGAVAAQTQEYKAYPQQLQPHKQMSGTNAGDLSGNNPPNMYNKAHSQMNKNYEKQGFQQSAQFNMANTTQSANLSSYAPQYLLPQQSMHHNLASAEQTQQGVGNQRSLSQTHKGASSNANAYQKFSWN